jgi:hypothetical protein
MNGLYHFQLGIPASVLNSLHGKTFENLIYSNHARNACVTDRYGYITKPPFSVSLDRSNIVEVEVSNGAVSKVVSRLPYDKSFDIIVVLVPHQRVVKTVWLNSKKDLHYTLDASKYSRCCK